MLDFLFNYFFKGKQIERSEEWHEIGNSGLIDSWIPFLVQFQGKEYLYFLENWELFYVLTVVSVFLHIG